MKNIQDIQKAVKTIIKVSEEPSTNAPLPSNSIKMPELALVMANYFNTLSKYCFSVYRGHTNHNQDIQKRKRQLRFLKDKKPPKKPLSAYLLYYSDQLNQTQQKNPSANNQTITKLVAQQWNSLSPEQKGPYYEEALKEKQKYEEEKEKYMEANPDYEEKPLRKSKKKSKVKRQIQQNGSEKKEEAENPSESPSIKSSSNKDQEQEQNSEVEELSEEEQSEQSESVEAKQQD